MRRRTIRLGRPSATMVSDRWWSYVSTRRPGRIAVHRMRGLWPNMFAPAQWIVTRPYTARRHPKRWPICPYVIWEDDEC